MQTVQGLVHSVHPLTASILQVRLLLSEKIPYLAGQYLKLHIDDEVYPFSIANAPLGAAELELHIRHSRDNSITNAIIQHIKETPRLTLSLPFGECTLARVSDFKHLIFVAAGTGFAPVKAILEQLLADGDDRSVSLFWAARNEGDLYLDEQVLTWLKHMPNWEYTPYLTDRQPAQPLWQSIFESLESISASGLILAGPFERMFALKADLTAVNLKENQLFSDAFDLT